MMISWIKMSLLFGLSAATAFALGGPVSSFDEAYRAVSRGRLSPTDAASFATWYGADNVAKGINPRSEDLRFIFAVATPGAAGDVEAESEDGKWSVKLKHLSGDLYGTATMLPEGAGFRWNYRIGANKIGGGQLEAYTAPPESKVQPGVPQGKLIAQPDWHSHIFEGTSRHWWIYVPAQYDPAKAACIFVIQDGQWTRGYWPTVLDNMIAAKQIPVSIAVFITPGTIKTDLDNRSIEYDTVSDRYPKMLAEEILPEVYKSYNIRQDPAAHLIAGLSSSGISSFNAAWFRPEVFGKVVSWIGSFTNLQGGPTGVAGGNTYPAIIRERRGWDQKGEPKPIRVFLQDGLNDLDNKAGNWPLSNQQMAKALEYGKYDYKFVLGNGFHSDMNGRAVLPDTLRWMWRDEPK
jgi:enterochelin esterase-like enzyme